MNIAITFTEHPIRRRYLNGLLEQLKVEFAEITPAIFETGERSLFENVDRCFRSLANEHGLCLYLQEDIQLASQFRRRLEEFICHHHRDVSMLYYGKQGSPPFVRLPVIHGGQCAVLADASIFGAYAAYSQKHATKKMKTMHDLFFLKFLRRSRYEVRAAIPSLVQHIGAFSAKLGGQLPTTGRARLSPTFKE